MVICSTAAAAVLMPFDRVRSMAAADSRPAARGTHYEWRQCGQLLHSRSAAHWCLLSASTGD